MNHIILSISPITCLSRFLTRKISDFYTKKSLGLSTLIVTFPLITASAVAQPQVEAFVGEVSLVLGEAHRLSKTGVRENLRRGSEIFVGDQINTRSNGHVHVHFVDDALVSVRPNSQLNSTLQLQCK